MVLLVDASVWVAAALPEEHMHTAAEEVVESSEHLAALDLTLYEVANAIGAKRREPLRARRACAVVRARSEERLVRVDRDLIAEGLEIVADDGLTAYDAAYVAVARQRGWTLVSTDARDLVSKGLAITPDAAL